MTHNSHVFSMKGIIDCAAIQERLAVLDATCAARKRFR